jgi:RNA polymerase sigma-70 factor (ECF subfamily)
MAWRAVLPPGGVTATDVSRLQISQVAMEHEESHLSRIQTVWWEVRRAHGNHPSVQIAQETLLERYGGAVRRYALAALRDDDAADEIVQEFALRFVRGDFAQADPERGRFRSFVKTVVYRMIVDYQRRKKKHLQESAIHSNVAEEDSAFHEPPPDDDAMFRASWRDELLARCWTKLAEDETQTGKPYSTVLRYRVEHPDERSSELAAGLSKKFGKPLNAGAVRVLLHRARDAFAELLLDDVLDSLENSTLEDAEAELIELDLLDYCRTAIDRRREK